MLCDPARYPEPAPGPPVIQDGIARIRSAVSSAGSRSGSPVRPSAEQDPADGPHRPDAPRQIGHTAALLIKQVQHSPHVNGRDILFRPQHPAIHCFTSCFCTAGCSASRAALSRTSFPSSAGCTQRARASCVSCSRRSHSSRACPDNSVRCAAAAGLTSRCRIGITRWRIPVARIDVLFICGIRAPAAPLLPQKCLDLISSRPEKRADPFPAAGQIPAQAAQAPCPSQCS